MVSALLFSLNIYISYCFLLIILTHSHPEKTPYETIGFKGFFTLFVRDFLIYVGL